MIGVNTFGLTRKIQEDLHGTFQAVAAAGYQELELLLYPSKEQGNVPFGVATEESIGMLLEEAKKNGLLVHSVHVFASVGTAFISAETVASSILKIYKDYKIDTFVFSGMFRDVEGAEQWGIYLRQLAELVKGTDCKILYHNHSDEFTPVTVNGTTMNALDFFFSAAGKDVGLQLDIGWAGVAGDEVGIARKYADRIVSIHLKDFIPETRGKYEATNMPTEHFSAIGCGEIRIGDVLAMRTAFSRFNGSIIVDQDRSTANILEDIAIGYRNIIALL